jgi:hypothetical protein
MAKTAAQKAAEETLKKAQEAAALRAGKTTAERLAEAKAAREEKLAATAAARPDARTVMAAKAEEAQLAMGKAAAERFLAQNPDSGAGGLVGSTVTKWMYDPKTGKKRTAQEIVNAVVEAVLASDDPNLRGVSLDPLTGKPRPFTDTQKVQAALAQLAGAANYEGSQLREAFEVGQLLRGDSRGAVTKALANRPDLWALGKETVGTIVDRKTFDDPKSVKRFVLDPTTNKLTPEQLKQYREIGAAGGMAIDPITGFAVIIDQQGGYTLGEQPEGDVTGLDFSTYQGGYTSPNYNPMRLFGGDETDSLGTDGMGTGGSGGMGGTSGTGGTGGMGFTGGASGATAFDVFKNTLGVFFGPSEMGKPWVNELYKTVSGFTKSGSTPEEAFNMALLQAEKNPLMTEFTNRFKGIFSLQKLKQEGKAVTVPTVAEYFRTQDTMGNLLKSSNLSSLANEDYLGDVIGKGVSATEFSNRLVSVFDRIDNASDINKKTISRFFPTLDRTQLAKALLTGEKGAKQLQQELAGYEVLSAAEQQGLGVSPTLLSGITNERAQQIARGGGTFESTLPQFGQIARARETEQKLAEISGVKSIGVSGLTDAVIGRSAKELKALEDLTMQEEARFAGKAGTAGSRALASQSRANRII